MADDLTRNSDSTQTKTVEQAALPAHNENLFAEFASSMAYSALEQPALGVSQFFGNGAMSSVQGFFSDLGIHKAEPEKFMSAGWVSQTLGGAVGMVLPFAVLKSGLGKAGVFGDAAVADAGLASQSSVLGLSLKESAITGFAYGAVFTPSQQTSSIGGFLGDRALGGLSSAATFSTLTAGSLALSRLSESALATQSGIASLLKNPVTSGVLSGVPAGLVSGESDSLISNHRFATATELAQSTIAMSMVGGVFGVKSAVQSKLAANLGTSGDATQYRTPMATRVAGLQDFAPDLLQSFGRTEGPANLTTPNLELQSTSRTDGSSKLESQTTARTDGSPNPPPDSIPNSRHIAGDNSSPSTIALLPEEQQLWSDIHQVRTPDAYRQTNERIEDGRLETNSYFSDLLAQQAKSWSDPELNAIWPEVLENDPHQAFRMAKQVGPVRMTRIWTNALPDAAANPDLAAGLANAMVFIEPGKQLDALQSLLALPKPPANVEMSSALLAAQNEIPAAKLLVEHGIKPQFETSKSSVGDWTDMIFDLPVGDIRNDMLMHLGKKISGSPKPVAQELNNVYRTAQEKADPSEFETLRAMLRDIDPRQQTENSATTRKTATDSLDPKFLGRLFFFDEDWPSSDKIAERNPEVIRALVNNTRLVGDLNRSAYLSSPLSAEPPVTATQLVDALTEKVNQSAEQNQIFPLSNGDLKALAEHGVEVTPQEVPGLLTKLQQQALSSLHLEPGPAEHDISKARVLTALTLADSFGKVNPEAYQEQFKEPIEKAMADSSLPYEQRLEAARALGELQRGGYDSAQAIHMPELRMTKFGNLSKDQQTQLRQQAEDALTNRPAMEKLLGDGPLGRLMPSVFGFSGEGGIVGRSQHSTHDSTVDVHVLDVVEKVAQDPEFQRLLPKEQTNLLWASLLHDVGKRENMVDLDHGWTSTATAWGVLRTLGYPDSRIQRITDLMSRDADLSFDPDLRNSTKLSDQKALDDVVASYRQPEALRMVQLLNRSDIKSVKTDGSWWTPEVSDELTTIRTMADNRVTELNKHLLPILTSQLPDGFSLSESADYNVLAHSSPNLLQMLRQRSTVESPEYSMSVSLLTPAHQNLYESVYTPVGSSPSPIVALVEGPFEHTAQAYRGNLSTGTSVGSSGHVELVRRWSRDPKAEALAQEADARLAAVGIPAARGLPAEQYPHLTQMRRVMAQFDNLDELSQAAGDDNEYVAGARQIAEMMTTEKDGSPLSGHNEIKLNNPIISGIGLLRKPGQSVYFEGTPQSDLAQMWNGSIPEYITSGPAGQAPPGALVVPQEIVESARAEGLPIVILDHQ